MQFTGIILRLVAAFSGFYVSTIFSSRVRRAKGSGVDVSLFFGMALFVLLGGIMEVIFAYYLFYIYQYELELLSIYSAGFFVGNCGRIGVVYFSERMLGKTKYIFTVLSIGFLMYGILFIHTMDEMGFFSTITIPITVFIWFVNMFYSLIIKTKGKILFPIRVLLRISLKKLLE